MNILAKKYPILIGSLCKEYRSHFIGSPTSDQLTFLELAMSGMNILLCGPAGSGKTYSIKLLSMKKKILLTATTGTAACLINGSTLDSILIQLEKRHCIEEFEYDIIIIDEVSMLTQKNLLKLDYLMRSLLNCELPFGGIQVILIGDFLQLPPVAEKSILFSPYLSELDFTIINLTTIMRQKDPVFANVLNNIRLSESLSPQSMKLLRTKGLKCDDKVIIVGSNAECDKYNNEFINKLSGDTYVYNIEKLIDCDIHSMENILKLKVGCKVIVTMNIDLSIGLSNGRVGIIESFKDGLPVISYEYKGVKHHKVINIADYFIHKHEMISNNGVMRWKHVKMLAAKQIPLRLAWALTVHKTQGQTLKAAIIICDKMYQTGHFYTALSRLKSSKYLLISGYKGHRICDRSRDILLSYNAPMLASHTFDELMRDNKYDTSIETLKSNIVIKRSDYCYKDELIRIINTTQSRLNIIVDVFTRLGVSDEKIMKCLNISDTSKLVEALWDSIDKKYIPSVLHVYESVESINKLKIVYVITDDIRDGVYKIGYHTGTLDGLRNRYRTAFTGYRLKYYKESDNHVALEREVHKRLKDYRITGEWFKAELDHIKMVIDECQPGETLEQSFMNEYKDCKNIAKLIREIKTSDSKYNSFSQYKIRQLIKQARS